MTTDELHAFVVRAKKATYVGNGEPAKPSRVGSHDLTYTENDFVYRDSYFGGTDFIGQETVWHHDLPIWSMCYHGYIIRADLITPTQAGTLLKQALSQPDAQGRLLDNFEHIDGDMQFEITSTGTIEHFRGRETIHVTNEIAYALDYFGGLIKS